MDNKDHLSESKFDYVLEQINRMFRVSDISQPISSASDIEVAREKSESNGFSHVPISDEDGNFMEYYDAKADKIISIKLGAQILSDGTGIMEIIPLMTKNEFFFVLTGDKIKKNIHFSDLNGPYISIGLYAKLNHLEDTIRRAVRKKVGNGEKEQVKYLKVNLSKNDFEKINRQYNGKKNADLQIDPINELYIDQELTLARELNLTKIDSETIKEFTTMRNSLVHFSDIIKRQEDVKKWVQFLDESDRIIKNANKFLNSQDIS